MKKFLIFLVVIVVGVSIGLTTYYFIRNDETITVNTNEIYCNVGDTVSLDDLNITVAKSSSLKTTTFDYNAGGDEVTSLINYNENKGYYEALKGGETTIVISTSNSKYPELKVSVHIGDGTEEYPYFIKSQSDLQKMGDTLALNANYSLINDITLNSSFHPIGYNYSTESWVGFSGTFNGNKHTINGMNLTSSDYDNAGLFYSLNSATVTNLYINNAKINGDYSYAGVLAGTASGTVSNVFVKNSSIINTKTGSVTGGIVGSITGISSKLTISSVTATTINLGLEAEEGVAAISVTAGGLVGIIDQATVQATYVDATMTVLNASGDIAGFTGKFIIGTDTGSIFESFSKSTLDTSYPSFISTVEKSSNYNSSNDSQNKLYHFAGNIVVTNNADLIKSYDSTLYTTFYNADNSIYFIRSVGSESEVYKLDTTDYVFYAVSQTSKTYWSNSAWTINLGALPKLNMTSSSLSTLTNTYLMKDVEEETIGNVSSSNDDNVSTFLNYLSSSATDGVITGKKLTLATDIDLTGQSYTPVALVNSIFDGGSHTIKGLTLTASNGYEGLFTYMDNSTVSNLTLENVSVSQNATYAGAVAGKVYSSSSTASEISNVTVSYTGAITSTITTFGGIVAYSDNNTSIYGVAVSSIDISSSASIQNAGGLVGINNSGVIKDSAISSSTLTASSKLGGLVAQNSDTVKDVTDSSVSLVFANTTAAYIGGVAGVNDKVVENIEIEVSVQITNAPSSLSIGGVAGLNGTNGEITSVTVSGSGITLSEVSGAHYIGGVAGINNGEITSANCYMDTIGSYYLGKIYFVAGIASQNAGKISQCIVTSDIYGNYVAGVACRTSESSEIDQVYVGGFDPETKELSQNKIRGDVEVAGVVIEVTNSATISNIQAKSELYGYTNDTVTSLIVLIFPNGATFDGATIDSSFAGYGTFYRDTWWNYQQKSGLYYYNIYQNSSGAGVMKNVVVNVDSAAINGKSYEVSNIRPTAFLWIWYTSDYNGNSYIKDVSSSEFNNAASFSGSFTISSSNGKVSYTQTLSFNFSNGTWVEDSGIRLSIVA